MSDTGSRLRRGTVALRQTLWGSPRDWINPRRKRFWVVAVLLLYTLAGFFLAPWIAKRQIVGTLEETFHRPVQLAEVRINPFVLSAEARGFALTETTGDPLVSFDRLFINFQLRSLFRWAWTFREITLERPSVEFLRYADGATNLGRLIGSMSPAEPEQTPPPSNDDALVRLIIDEFNLVEGGGRFLDRVPRTPFEAPVGPIDVRVRDISTLPDDRGEQRVSIHTERGSNLAWQGTLQVDPLHSSGRFTATGPFIPLGYRYFQDQLDVEVANGIVDLALDYEVNLQDTGELRSQVRDLTFVIRELQVNQQGQSVVTMPSLRVEGGYLELPAQRAGAALVAVEGPQIFAWLDADSTVNFAKAVRPDVAAAEADGASPPSAASQEPAPAAGTTVAASDGDDPLADWQLHLDRFAITDLAITFEDRTLRQPGQVRIDDLDLTLDDLDNAPNARFPLSLSIAFAPAGHIGLTGQVGALPAPALDGKLTIDDLALAIAQPYVGDVAAVQIDDGAVNGRIDLSVTDAEPFGAAGTVSLDRLDVADVRQEEQLLRWASLGVDRFTFSQADNKLAVSEVTFAEPYARLRIDRDGTTNFAELTVADDASGATVEEAGDGAASAADTLTETETRTEAESDVPASDGSADLAITVGRIGISDGATDFTDLSLPLPFSNRISDLEGEMTTFDTASSQPSKVRLEGQIADYGLARIQGSLMPMAPDRSTDIEVLFRNVAIPDLTPYTIRFAGREIDEGRMDVALDYKVDEGQMLGRNSVVLSNLKLGDKVDNPDAFDLPLGLAVALLKGPDGNIDVDVPVEGDINDPQFRIGGVILKAVVNLITNIVTSPFRLLGNLVGVDSEDFGQIEWEPGVAALTPPEREKLEKIGEALALRPELALRVGGVFDPATDLAALKQQAVQNRIDEALAGQQSDADAMLSERRRAAVESLFTADFPDTPLEDVELEFTTPVDPEDPEGEQRLDEAAYVAELEERLVDAAPIGEAELGQLASARVDAVTRQLTEQSQVDAQRISGNETKAVETNDDGWIVMALDVDAGDVAASAPE